MSNTSLEQTFRYPFEEFTDHIKAMKTVREWEYTSRFGHLGSAQTSRANSARVVEYFSDSYSDLREAVYKAELFLSIYDYIGRHTEYFAKSDLVEVLKTHSLSVDAALLRAVHHIFTTATRPAAMDPRKALALARALKDIAQTV